MICWWVMIVSSPYLFSCIIFSGRKMDIIVHIRVCHSQPHILVYQNAFVVNQYLFVILFQFNSQSREHCQSIIS